MELTLEDVIAARRQATKAAAAAAEDVLPPEEIGRHELTNEQWAMVRKHLPMPTTRRGLPRGRRQLLNGMLWILRTGAPWRDLPDRYGPWTTVWHNFDAWRRDGVLERVKAALLRQLADAGELDWDLWCVDGSSVRASRVAAGARKGGAQRTSRKTTRSAARGGATAPKCIS
jgi:transposase